jgi:hypothetical protein
MKKRNKKEKKKERRKKLTTVGACLVGCFGKNRKPCLNSVATVWWVVFKTKTMKTKTRKKPVLRKQLRHVS